VDRWISDGVFTPIDNPENGRARGWTRQDALRLACFVRLVDAGLRVEVGRAINRVPEFEFVSEPEFLVVLAHKNAIWREEGRADGTSVVVTGERYDAFVRKKSEAIAQFGVTSWTSLAIVFVNLDDVKDAVRQAWLYAMDRKGVRN
jgi:hypothetical protein